MIGGFAAGLIFGVDGVDHGGGATNNWWIIWTVVFLTAIGAGIVLEIANKIKRVRK